MSRVLVVEDSRTFSSLLSRRITEEMGHTVVVADSKAKAEEILAADTDFFVALLDLNLPGRGGQEVLESLTDANSPIKVLVVSMFAEDQYAIRALRAGAYGYVNKGGDPAQIVAAVRTVAQGRT